MPNLFSILPHFREKINAFSNNIILNYRFIFFKSTLRNVGCRTESLVLYWKHPLRKKVVSMEHPMEKTHFLSFFAYVTSDRISFIKCYPEQNPMVRFPMMGHGTIYSYCNRHGLFQVSVWWNFMQQKKSGISVGLFSLYSAEVIVPPPTTISPSYSTTAWPAVTARCGSANTTCTVPSSSGVTVAAASLAW